MELWKWSGELTWTNTPWMFPIDFLGPIQKKRSTRGRFHGTTTHGGTIFFQSEAPGCFARIIPTSQWVGTDPQSLLHLVAEESRKFPEGKCEVHAVFVQILTVWISILIRDPRGWNVCDWISKRWTRWWFQIFFIFTPIPGEMIQFD